MIQIARKDYEALNKDYRGLVDGQPYMLNNDNGATVYAPVQLFDQIIHNCWNGEYSFKMGIDYDNSLRMATYTNLTTGKTWRDNLKVNHSMRFIACKVS